MDPCEKWNSSAGRILRIQSEISVQVCFEGAASCEMEYLCADVEESALEVLNLHNRFFGYGHANDVALGMGPCEVCNYYLR